MAEILDYMYERDKRQRLLRMEASLGDAVKAVGNLRFDAEALFIVLKNNGETGKPCYQFSSQGFTAEELGSMFEEVKSKL